MEALLLGYVGGTYLLKVCFDLHEWSGFIWNPHQTPPHLTEVFSLLLKHFEESMSKGTHSNELCEPLWRTLWTHSDKLNSPPPFYDSWRCFHWQLFKISFLFPCTHPVFSLTVLHVTVRKCTGRIILILNRRKHARRLNNEKIKAETSAGNFTSEFTLIETTVWILLLTHRVCLCPSLLLACCLSVCLFVCHKACESWQCETIKMLWRERKTQS